ncbi:MFS transporter [Bacillus litorisediminis]|uniref:MFS transporter n=1 Tax=Bacillus litorisediminis TaxID=2922713 RepID=UPI001FAD0654|nr:MFS transporter [Bacillus litorisediminis]
MEKQPKLWTRNFILVSISNFFVFLTFYYLLILLPIYALDFLNVSEAEVGLLVTVFLISAIVSRPFAGQWVSRYGIRKVFIASAFIFAAGATLYFLPQSIGSLLVLRFFHGIGFGMATTATGTIVANVIPPLRRGEGMGYYVLFVNLAMVIGPFLGLTAIQDWGAETTFSMSAIFGFLALLTGLMIKFPNEIKQESTQKAEKIRFRIGDMFERPAVKISVVGAFFAIAYSSILAFVSVYASQIGLAKVASYFFVVYAVVLLLSRPFTGKWFDQYGANVIIYPALIIFAIGVFVLSGAESAFIFLLAAALVGLGWGTVFPSLQTIAIQEASPGKSGLATATYLSIFDIGMGLGSFLVGIIGAEIGLNSLYFYSSIYILAGIGLYYLLHGKRKEASATRQVLSENK